LVAMIVRYCYFPVSRLFLQRSVWQSPRFSFNEFSLENLVE
jgi:hypothetical protein